MKKLTVIPVLLTLFFAGVVSAETYYPNSYSNSQYVSYGNCVVISSDLTYGSRGNDVSKLQKFLVDQNYPGGGAWMITGYFGNATVQAVRNFQQAVGVPVTGFADTATRSAVQSRSCGVLGQGVPVQGNIFTDAYVPNYTYTPAPTYPYATQYINPGYTYPPYSSIPLSLSPTINSLSVTSGPQGTSVIVYGANFDIYNSSVRFGSNSIVPALDATQTTLKFNVPNVPSGSYPVTVTTLRGISNALSFNVTVGTTNCGNYYPYSCNQQIEITSLTPTSGAAGTTVTVYGNGFSTLGNTVYFDGVAIPNVSSYDGHTLSFSVPYQTGGYVGQQGVTGTYPVSVKNVQGQVSNTRNFSVTSSGGGGNAPVISSVTGPNTLSVGSQGTWTLTLSAPIGTYVTTSVHWGDETLYAYAASGPQSTTISGQQTLTFTHTYQSVGSYTPIFTVTGPGGSNVASATVQVSIGGGSSNGSLALSSITPNSAHTGVAVTLYGSGFTTTGNDVHFGVGGVRNLSSNGSSISFTIPSWVSPCDLIQTVYVCGAPSTQVVPGVYPVYVTNSTGATNVINFTVTY